ncbi:MAG: hypothetical protein JRJ56_08410, partial [Deltaproteobacteria bacterium]|nr:hypothetical protein [Deltaproteobacteria bacterium]
ERQKRKIRIYHRLVDRSLLLGGFLVPGIFQVAIGNTVRGVFMLAGSFLLAASVYCRSARIITRGIFPPGSPWATTVLPAALFLLLLAVNLLSWRQRKQQKTIVAGCF